MVPVIQAVVLFSMVGASMSSSCAGGDGASCGVMPEAGPVLLQKRIVDEVTRDPSYPFKFTLKLSVPREEEQPGEVEADKSIQQLHGPPFGGSLHCYPRNATFLLSRTLTAPGWDSWDHAPLCYRFGYRRIAGGHITWFNGSIESPSMVIRSSGSSGASPSWLSEHQRYCGSELHMPRMPLGDKETHYTQELVLDVCTPYQECAQTHLDIISRPSKDTKDLAEDTIRDLTNNSPNNQSPWASVSGLAPDDAIKADQWQMVDNNALEPSSDAMRAMDDLEALVAGGAGGSTFDDINNFN